MALIDCPECGKEVSTRATNCPHCGSPIRQESNRVSTSNDNFFTRQRGCGDLVIYGGLAFLILLVLFASSC